MSTWERKVIALQIDHINGDPWDHRIHNIRLLCPNCHSQTNTYSGRTNGKKTLGSRALQNVLIAMGKGKNYIKYWDDFIK